jgi:N-formylglutamate deformylase
VTLPLLLSVPHGGLRIPPEAEDICILSEEDIIKDGDEGARDIYAPLQKHVAAFVTTDIARAIVDMNRAEDDFRKDGVIKTHTCWDVPVYRHAPSGELIENLLARYHRPYHARLTDLVRSGVVLALDCHTMAASGPPVGPDPGRKRPSVCLGDAGGSVPVDWRDTLLACLRKAFGEGAVTLNDPFRGGYIARTHGREMPWVQLELSRAPFTSNAEKAARVLRALTAWVEPCGLRTLP